MSNTPDLPPAYTTLKESSLNITNIEDKDTDPICGDGSDPLVDHTFENKSIRLIFIQKLLMVKLLQLLGATMIMLFFERITWRYYYILDYNFVHFVVVSSLLYIVTYGLLICCDDARRQNPYRYIFLVAYPATFAFLVGILFGNWRFLPLFMMAWGNYCVAMFSLLAYNILVINSKLEFNTVYGIMIAGAAQTVVFAITVPMFDMNAFFVLYPTLILTLHFIYVLCDIQAMTTKNYPATLTPDDFVDGVINLYIDYVFIFRSHVLPKWRQLWAKCMLCTEVGRASSVNQ